MISNATARFAMHAGCAPVCGNLFHHAVEMFPNVGLAQRRELSDLERMRHKLKEKLWPAFKEDFPNAHLTQHDKTLACVDKFEDIRYPDEVLKSGMGVLAVWSGRVSELPRGAEQYVIVVSDIDDLIVDVLKVYSRNPVALIGSSNPAAREAITRTTTTPCSFSLHGYRQRDSRQLMISRIRRIRRLQTPVGFRVRADHQRLQGLLAAVRSTARGNSPLSVSCKFKRL
jgi:hypothetical protein